MFKHFWTWRKFWEYLDEYPISDDKAVFSGGIANFYVLSVFCKHCLPSNFRYVFLQVFQDITDWIYSKNEGTTNSWPTSKSIHNWTGELILSLCTRYLLFRWVEVFKILYFSSLINNFHKNGFDNNNWFISKVFSSSAKFCFEFHYRNSLVHLNRNANIANLFGIVFFQMF